MAQLIKDNEMVVTINDTTEKRSDCRRINGIFYKIGDISIEDSGQCYIINEKYYKSNTGYIIFDHTLKQYVIKNATNLIEGVVGLHGDKLIKGFFSNEAGIDLPKLVTPEGDQYACVSNEVIKGGGYLMNLRFNAYAHRLKHRVEEFINPGQVNSNIKNGLPYDSRGQMSSLIKYHQDVYKPTISSNVSKYGKLLGDLTFGVEFETIKGQVPQSLTNEVGMIALRDGSIGGLEYATIPLQGEKGLQTLINSVDALKKYTTYDKSCSIHYHIGNVPRTEGFMLALFKTLCTLENQMYEIFPLYKQFNYGVKRKHYTRPYPFNETMFQFDKVITKSKLKDNFSILYSYLSMGQKYKNVGYDLSNVEYHPSDPRGNSKWNIRSRYHWVNLIPLLFGNKQTVEFRLHTPTYDHEKIMYYLMLCASIINFVIENEKAILEKPEILNGLSISDIGYKMAGYTKYGNNDINIYAGYLYEYLRYRKDHFYGDARQGIINGDEDNFKNRKRIVWSKATDDDIELSKTRVSKRGNDKDYIVNYGFDERIGGDFNPNFIDGGRGMAAQIRGMIDEDVAPMPEVVAPGQVIWRG